MCGDLPEKRLLVLKLMLTLMLTLLPTNTARGLPVSALLWAQRQEANLNLNLLPPLAAWPPCLSLTHALPSPTLPISPCRSLLLQGGKKDLPAASLRQRFLPGVFVFRI